MNKIVQNLINIENNIKSSLSELKINNQTKIIAVSKTFELNKILPLIEYGHIDFGENKVQEAVDKWTDVKKNNQNIKLHMIGKLQTNKVKFAVKLFDYIHSVDSEKLASKIYDESLKLNKNIKIFIQVNLAEEIQKSGIKIQQLESLVSFCKFKGLDLIGLMCIPPFDIDPSEYFKEINILNQKYGFSELSMGMSSDYIKATQNGSTYVRIGSSIFGKRN